MATTDSLPFDHIDSYRKHLVLQHRSVAEQVASREQYETLSEQHNAEIEALNEVTPKHKEDSTELEYLTVRAAEVDRDLTTARHELALSELWLTIKKFQVEERDLDLRIGQLDHLVEAGPIAAGNDALLALLTLETKQAAADQVSAATDVELARQRLALTKREHRDVHATLRRLQRPSKQAKR